MNKDFSYYLSKFLKDYLVIERNVSKNTIRSYTKTFQLLIDYLVNNKKITLNNITFNTITRNIIIDFLNHLEEKLVILTGKGSKQRVVPIMENTKEILLKYINYQCLK